MNQKPKLLPQIEDYAQFIGEEAVARISAKAKLLAGQKVIHVNSTYYGGGVAKILHPLTFLMNSVGIETEWAIIHGEPDFFSVTKKIHNALQGGEIRQTDRKMEIYEDVIYKNATRMHLGRYDYVIIHDPQPLFLIYHFRKKCPWVWRCHIDLSSPDPETWEYLKPAVEMYDTVIVSSEDYKQKIKTPQRVFMPAIDPFAISNKDLTLEEINERLEHHGIPTDLPLIVQISRFDRWKDPEGVIQAYKKAREQVECTLVLLGETATDDPEGEEVYHSLLSQREERIILISRDDSALVNALQRKAAVVLQKSLREGFGLTVTEAMWKGTPVIGGNVGGIRLQIADGQNGFLVSSVDEAADRIVMLLKDENLRRQMGIRARELVKEQFLLSRLLEQYIDLLSAFEVSFFLR